MGVKGFQKGHIVSKETRMKISKANDGNFFAKDYKKAVYWIAAAVLNACVTF